MLEYRLNTPSRKQRGKDEGKEYDQPSKTKSWVYRNKTSGEILVV